MSKPYEAGADTDMVLAVHLANPAGPDDVEDAVDKIRQAFPRFASFIEEALPSWKVYYFRCWQSKEEFVAVEDCPNIHVLHGRILDRMNRMQKLADRLEERMLAEEAADDQG